MFLFLFLFFPIQLNVANINLLRAKPNFEQSVKLISGPKPTPKIKIKTAQQATIILSFQKNNIYLMLRLNLVYVNHSAFVCLIISTFCLMTQTTRLILFHPTTRAASYLSVVYKLKRHNFYKLIT